MKQQTRLDHEERIENAVRYIAEHIDDDIDLRELADQVCLSRFHFHRVFQAMLGETVGEMVRRLRLERAACSLRSTGTPITELAFEAGYATHEAFIRAFRTAYSCTPSTLRRKRAYEGRLPTPNGVHYGKRSTIRFIASKGAVTMQIEIREFEPRKAVCIAHTGPYFMIGKAFSELDQWLKENGGEESVGIGLYYDDPQSTPAKELRSDAGAFVPNDFVTDDPRVHIVDVPGGAYAVATHIGPYDGLPNAWNELVGWLPANGYSYGNAPGIEIYIDDCSKVPATELRTELCAPIQ